MHTNKTPLTDTILSHQGVASLIFSNALDQVAKLAKVSQQEALALLVTEVKMYSQDTPKDIDNIYYTPIVEHTEQKYIYSLFK
mgnify:CR=1 FL=1